MSVFIIIIGRTLTRVDMWRWRALSDRYDDFLLTQCAMRYAGEVPFKELGLHDAAVQSDIHSGQAAALRSQHAISYQHM